MTSSLAIPHKSLEAMKLAYLTASKSKGFNLLLLATPGKGKTRFLERLYGIGLVHSFDPKGTNTIAPLIHSGKVFVNEDFEKGMVNRVTAFQRHIEEYEKLKSEGVFNTIDFFCIDGGGRYAESVEFQVMKKEGRLPADWKSKTVEGMDMRIQDWKTVGRVMNKWVPDYCSSLPCNFILTMNIEQAVDGVTGGYVYKPAISGKSADVLPSLFDFVWYLTADKTGERWVTMQPDGRYDAKTRDYLGGATEEHKPLGEVLGQKQKLKDLPRLFKEAGYEDLFI